MLEYYCYWNLNFMAMCFGAWQLTSFRMLLVGLITTEWVAQFLWWRDQS
jgi:hypothetical protein